MGYRKAKPSAEFYSCSLSMKSHRSFHPPYKTACSSMIWISTCQQEIINDLILQSTIHHIHSQLSRHTHPTKIHFMIQILTTRRNTNITFPSILAVGNITPRTETTKFLGPLSISPQENTPNRISPFTQNPRIPITSYHRVQSQIPYLIISVTYPLDPRLRSSQLWPQIPWYRSNVVMHSHKYELNQ